MTPRLALAALSVLALAACDLPNMPGMTKPEPEAAAPAPSGPPQPPSVSPLDSPIEIAGGEKVAVATADATTVGTQNFLASGAGWIVGVSGKSARYRRGEGNWRYVDVQRLVFARGVEYVGTLDGAAFALTIRGDACQGGAAPMTATLRVGGRTLSGCAAEGEAFAARKQAPEPVRRAAPKAAPKPAAPKPAPAATPAPTPAPALGPATAPAPTTTPPAGPAPTTPPAAPAPAPTTPPPATGGGSIVPPPPFVVNPFGTPPGGTD